jgi:tRNA U55 pseudouridine synthase TruB
MKGAAMSKLEKTAQEIASEALNFTSKEYYKVNQMNETNTVNHEVLTKIASLPQLTIPKSIADELDKVEMNWNTLKDEAQGWPTDDLIMWLDEGNNPLMFAYLAGKALGVDLVKVVEG